jgi:hypothetical protein
MSRKRIRESSPPLGTSWPPWMTLFVSALLALYFPVPNLAQTSDGTVNKLPTMEIALVGGVSPVPAPSPGKSATRPAEFSVIFGQTVGSLRIYAFAQDRSEELIATRYLHPSGSVGPLRCDYIIQAMPIYRLIQPRYYDYDSVALTTQRRSAFGEAIFPVGERINFVSRDRLQAFLYSSGGFSYWTRRILSEGGARLNMNVQFGTEFEYSTSDKHSISFGYAINHLSNGNTNIKNPGLDANLLYVAYSLRRRRSVSLK